MATQGMGTVIYSELDFGRSFRRRNVVAEECAIRAVLLLLDRHRELVKGLGLESALAQDARELARQCALVVLSSEERDGLAGVATAAWTK